MKQRILVVDDEPEIVSLIEYNLESHGYQVETAGNGVEALASILRNHPDLLIADVMMPEMDGFELVDHIRRDPTLVDLPVVLLTAKSQDSDIWTGYKTGADMYLTKPFNPEELLAFVARILGSGRPRGGDAPAGASPAADLPDESAA